MQRNFLIKLCYDGSRYHGWQIQENAVTVQQVFQEALGKITGLSEDIKACSRTDTGVHAREFCVSLKTESPIPPERLLAGWSARFGTSQPLRPDSFAMESGIKPLDGTPAVLTLASEDTDPAAELKEQEA